MKLKLACISSVLLAANYAATAAPRQAPAPLPHHPGNVFLAGEMVDIRVAGEGAWHLVDYDERPIAEINPANGRADLGRLSAGWYRLRHATKTNDWISLAVLDQPQPTPTNSPISIDVAMSWFYPTNQMRDVASLCSLAGVNWVRDRLNWGEMEPGRGRFVANTRYDAAAKTQSDAGLRVLQVNHISPKWASNDPKRFPADLRDIYAFYREMAARWKTEVPAFEPWNEADITQFGGHTGAEMASFQKAAYLGLKAGNPLVIACLNVWAVHRHAQLDDFASNHAEAYFDTYNLHHYEPITGYPALYADHRRVSAGKPMWVSEFAMPVKWSGDEKRKELNDAELRRQSERLVKAFAASLIEGPEQSFYFMLPHYVEGQTQFGILRPDLTPRPAYLALAAVSRFLGPAKALGKVVTTNQNLHVYAFTQAKSELLVAWSDSPATLDLPAAIQAQYDHLGRTKSHEEGTKELLIRGVPSFAFVPGGTAKQLSLLPAPAKPTAGKASASPATLVLQPLMPADKAVLEKSAWRVPAGKGYAAKFAAYNFGAAAVDAPLHASSALGSRLQAPDRLRCPPGARTEIEVIADLSGTATGRLERIEVTAADAVISIGLVAE